MATRRTLSRSSTKPSSPASPPSLDPDREPRGQGDELQQQRRGQHGLLTTNHGAPLSDNQNSLRAFDRGPTLLEDFVLREKIFHFDHERIPERIVHARGSAAHGVFELHTSLDEYTTAKVLTQLDKPVPVFCRFSTVAGGAGSVDTPRDVRGFAVKFYTEDGNWDLVGNNMPVFFIQDAMKFPDLVHSVKMEPDRGFPQAASAHDTFWDFISLMPESMHMIMWAMSDRGIPRSLRMIEGFGVHSFRLLDAKGGATFVKFHWRPTLGMQSTLWDEAVKLAGADPDFHRRDLFEAIQVGNHPAWDLAVQLFTEDEAAGFPFDHLDATKLIPEELVPLRIIGRMTLNRWPDNFFAETEQVAYCPSHLVPGIDFSNDPLLQGRLFSYLDTQMSRLGSSNFHQLPINAPKCPFLNFQRDGHMQRAPQQGRVNYEPSSLDLTSPRAVADGLRHFAQAADGCKGRLRAESFADHYTQARLFFRSQTGIEQMHMAAALVFELSKVASAPIRERVVGHLRCVDESLARRVADGLGLAELPPAAAAQVAPKDMPLSRPLSIVANMKPMLEGRAVAVLVDDGADAKLVRAIIDAVRRAKATVKVVAPKIGGVALSDGSHLAADGQLAGTPSVLFDAIAVIVGNPGAARLIRDAAACDFVRHAFGHLKAIAYSEDAKALLEQCGIDQARYDAGVVPAAEAVRFIEAASRRQWDREDSSA
jgi:catalase